MLKFDMSELGNACAVLNGDRGINYPSGTDFVSYGIPFINAGHIKNGKIDFTKMDYISEAHYLRMGGAKLKKNDVVLCLRGSLGKYALILKDDGAPASSLAVLRSERGKLEHRYLIQLLGSQIISNQISTENNGSSQPNLSALSVKKFLIPLPSLEEQTAIAEALSETDNLISSLEKLIAKKKAIKQGAMQELLTGKKRLPGFDGEWKQICIGDEQYTHIDYENLSSETSPEYEFKYITLENVDNGNLLSTVKCKYSTAPSRARRIVHQDDILFGTVRPNLRSHLFIDSECSNTICSTGFCVIKGRPNMLWAKFLYYKLFTSEIDTQVEAIISGSNYPALSSVDVKSLKIALPPTIKEQISIASILSDMDTEIGQLEKKLEKYLLIKQGMMQELLTGRIRLVGTRERQEKKLQKSHNQNYDDAIAISAIVNAFYDDRFILGRVKVQKLLYLLRRKQDADTSAFKKKAAGPYNEQARYKGGESIAIKSGYIAVERGNKGSKFSKGSSIDTALKYAGNMQADIDWLLEKFRFYNTSKETKNLEVLATVDMASRELEQAGIAVNLDAVKNLIRTNKAWAPKLQKPYFSDAAINQAILECKELFG